MIEELTFTIAFHAPFRVATGRAGSGLDVTVDITDPLPASSLKGLMRDSATSMLRADPKLISEVFGSPKDPSPWTWSSAEPVDSMGRVGQGWQPSGVQTRVTMDAETHTVVEDLIMFAETVEHQEARYCVLLTSRVVDNDLRSHRALLRASAAAVHNLGGGRTRGLGWVTIAERQGNLTEGELKLIRLGGDDA